MVIYTHGSGVFLVASLAGSLNIVMRTVIRGGSSVICAVTCITVAEVAAVSRSSSSRRSSSGAVLLQFLLWLVIGSVTGMVGESGSRTRCRCCGDNRQRRCCCCYCCRTAVICYRRCKCWSVGVAGNGIATARVTATAATTTTAAATAIATSGGGGDSRSGGNDSSDGCCGRVLSDVGRCGSNRRGWWWCRWWATHGRRRRGDLTTLYTNATLQHDKRSVSWPSTITSHKQILSTEVMHK